MVKRAFEMPVRIGGVLWLKDEPCEPFRVTGYRIGRMMGEDEEDYEEDYPEEEWYMQLCGEGEEWSTPISDIGESFFLKFFDAYNQKIQELDEKYDGKYTYVLDFLYASDCDASMNLEHCKSIYDIIKEYDDKVCYGYIGRPDCAMFSDFKEVIKDAIESGEGIEWF